MKIKDFIGRKVIGKERANFYNNTREGTVWVIYQAEDPEVIDPDYIGLVDPKAYENPSVLTYRIQHVYSREFWEYFQLYEESNAVASKRLERIED